MAVQRGHRPRGLENEARGMARQAQANIWVDRITRLGYFARGVIYGLIGFLAVQLIFNGRGRITDQQGALATLARQPYGKILLIIVAIGLVGLFIWGLIRALADPYHKGSDAKGIIARLGFLISGISYGALFIPTLNLIRGSGQATSSTPRAQAAAANILTKPWGPWVVGLIGLILIGVGLYRIYLGYKGKLNERLKGYEMTAEQRKIAVRTGRAGYIALGIVFMIIGFLAFYAATTRNPAQIGGFDQALTFLSHQPYGPYLLAIVGLGLICFAVYSFMGALWFRIKEL